MFLKAGRFHFSLSAVTAHVRRNLFFPSRQTVGYNKKSCISKNDLQIQKLLKRANQAGVWLVTMSCGCLLFPAENTCSHFGTPSVAAPFASAQQSPCNPCYSFNIVVKKILLPTNLLNIKVSTKAIMRQLNLHTIRSRR